MVACGRVQGGGGVLGAARLAKHRYAPAILSMNHQIPLESARLGKARGSPPLLRNHTEFVPAGTSGSSLPQMLPLLAWTYLDLATGFGSATKPCSALQ
jgi:hypothetical protein